MKLGLKKIGTQSPGPSGSLGPPRPLGHSQPLKTLPISGTSQNPLGPQELPWDYLGTTKLTPLSGEVLQSRTSNNSNEARVDIRTRGFWERGQQTFSEIRVFDLNACRYRNNSLQQCHVINEQEKNRAYNERILQVDHGTFTPLVFNQRQYEKRVPKVLLAFGTDDI